MMTEKSVMLRALELIDLAKRSGVVLTIELKPNLPLAMGNYEMVVDVRPAREPA